MKSAFLNLLKFCSEIYQICNLVLAKSSNFKKYSLLLITNWELFFLFSKSSKLLRMHRHFYYLKTWGWMGTYSFPCHTVKDRYQILLYY